MSEWMNKEFSSSFGIALVMLCVFLCLKVLRWIITISTLQAYFMGIISYTGVFQVQEKHLLVYGGPAGTPDPGWFTVNIPLISWGKA